MSWLEYPSIPRCQAEARKNDRTGKCNQPLDDHGQCPLVHSHIQDIEMPEYDEEAALRLVTAIEDPIYHEILKWEAEGGSL